VMVSQQGGLSFMLRRVLPRSGIRASSVIISVGCPLPQSRSIRPINLQVPRGAEPDLFCYSWQGVVEEIPCSPGKWMGSVKSLDSLPKRKYLQKSPSLPALCGAIPRRLEKTLNVSSGCFSLSHHVVRRRHRKPDLEVIQKLHDTDGLAQGSSSPGSLFSWLVSTGDGECESTSSSKPADSQADAGSGGVLYSLNTRYNVVRDVCSSLLGWMAAECEEEADLVWQDCCCESEASEVCARLRPFQRFNHFPGMSSIYRKCCMAQNLNRMRKVCGAAYDFFPESWVLPADATAFRAQLACNGGDTFIVKPDRGCQGQGIFLVNDSHRLPDLAGDAVAQRYLARPMLLDGHKMDIRLHVLVTGCDPLRAFLHRAGIVRLASDEYLEPKKDNLKQHTVHITNGMQNTSNPNFNPEDSDHGHRRSWEVVCQELKGRGVDMERMLTEIDEILVKTLIVAQPCISHMYNSHRPGDIENRACFEILGFDIMLDENAKPWLLEVNHMPAFTTEFAIDKPIKTSLLGDAMKLLDLTAENKIHRSKSQRSSILDKERLSWEARRQLKWDHAQERTEWEILNSGSYRMLYPTCGSKTVEYAPYFQAAVEFSRGLSTVAVKAIGEAQLSQPRLQTNVQPGVRAHGQPYAGDR